MPDQAPRIHPALHAALARLDRRRTPIAETHRRLARLAELLGMTRPSYEQVRVLVHSTGAEAWSRAPVESCSTWR